MDCPSSMQIMHRSIYTCMPWPFCAIKKMAATLYFLTSINNRLPLNERIYGGNCFGWGLKGTVPEVIATCSSAWIYYLCLQTRTCTVGTRLSEHWLSEHWLSELLIIRTDNKNELVIMSSTCTLLVLFCWKLRTMTTKQNYVRNRV